MLRSGFLLVCILGLATAAQADFSVMATATGSVGDGTVDPVAFSQHSSALQFPEAADPMFAEGSINFQTRAGGSATATATFGRLRAQSSASAGAIGASAATSAKTQTDDTLHVQSPTLANGTPVSLSIVFFVFDGYVSSPTTANAGRGYVLARLDAGTGHVGGGLHLFYELAPDIVSSPDLSGTVAAQVGDAISLTYQINTSTKAAFPYPEAPGGIASAVLGGSVLISVDGATPDVTLIADSGYDYTQTVPEPSAAASLGAALVSLLGIGVVRVRGGRV